MTDVVVTREPQLVDDDTDSAPGDNAGSTVSLSSSILETREINGRWYHGEEGNAQY